MGSLSLISYAYLQKHLEYKCRFTRKNNFFFGNHPVMAFEANTESQRNNVEVLQYTSEEEFVIKLRLK